EHQGVGGQRGDLHAALHVLGEVLGGGRVGLEERGEHRLQLRAGVGVHVDAGRLGQVRLVGGGEQGRLPGDHQGGRVRGVHRDVQGHRGAVDVGGQGHHGVVVVGGVDLDHLDLGAGERRAGDVVGGGGAVRDERGERLGALLPAALLDVEVVLGEADGEGGGRGLGEARALLLLGRLLGGGGREAFAQRVPDPVEQDDDDEGPEHRPA